MKKVLVLLITVFSTIGILTIGLSACGSDGESITLYSGRSESLISEIISRWEDQSGIDVEVKYGDSADLALLINEEGDKSPADVFISQSPGAVGYLAAQDLLAPIPQNVATKILPEYRSSDRSWVGITGRQRVLVYNTNMISPEDLPSSVDELLGEEYRGRVAVAPMNGSFQDFVTAMRFERGDTATLEWLEGMANNNSPNYPKNSAIVSAVVSGEVEMGLVNHYYLLRELAENPNAAGVNHYLDSDDIGSLLIITAGAILESSDKKDTAAELLDFLISAEAQNYFVEQTREYPLIAGVEAPSGVPDLNAFSSPSLNNFEQLGSELLGTIQLIEESGIIRG